MADQNLTRDEAASRARTVSEVGYTLHLELSDDPAAVTFPSTATVTFSLDDPGAGTFLDLEAEAVESLEVNGASRPVDTFDGHRIHLTGLAAENTVVVRARCAYQKTGVGLHRFVDPADGEVYLFTHFEPFDAHKVLACFDQPDLKGALALTVTAPSRWVVVANGPATGEAVDGSLRTTTYAPTPRISPYLFALVAGNFHHVHRAHGDVEMGLFCRTSLAPHLDPDELFTITQQGLDWYAETFGIPYPFGPKYDQLFVPEFNMGAMENPGCITFNETYVFRSRTTESARGSRANTVLHEMAHMWFGDLVTMRWWDDLWLNESFATVFATLAKSEATRFGDAWVDFAYVEKGWALRQDQLPTTHPVAADMPDTEAVRLNFDGITYAKGAATLRQLVAYVGLDAFVTGLRAYFAEHAWGNATFSDLLTALEASSGRDLHDWTRAWLQTSGPSLLHAEVAVKDGRVAAVTVAQESDVLRPHRIAIGLYSLRDGSLVRTRQVETDIVGASTSVDDLVGEVAPDLVLVNDDDLTFAKVRFDARSLATLREHLATIDDALARALCWGTLWDMTRDAEITAAQYVELVTRHGVHETDVTVLERLLLQATSAIEIYARPAARAELRTALHRTAGDAMRAAEPAGDQQLVWAHSWIATAQTPDELGAVRGLLDGATSVPGLTVDTDVRWLAVGRLAALGADDGTLVDAELERDNTSMGRLRALRSRAARPETAAKSWAWEQITDNRSLSLQELGAVIAGFEQPDQEHLVASYLSQYEELVADWWRTRTADEAEELTAGLYPTYRADHAVVAAADAVLARDDVQGSPRRLLLEARDATQRAMRARAADGEASRAREAVARV